MFCPYCHAPAFEAQPACERCGFSIERIEPFFGVMPRLKPGLSDLAGIFAPRETRRLKSLLGRFSGQFPQIGFSIVTTVLESGQPLSAYAFWIFNRGGICRQLERGRSRDLLLTVDAANARASLMIGYGLEPFVPAPQLQEMINAGAPDFAAARWVDAAAAVIEKSGVILREVAEGLGPTYGLDMDAVRSEENPVARHPAGTF
jgi:uncharacterized membrane protein YgcG